MLAIHAIKELKAENDKQQSEIESLKQRLELPESKLSGMNPSICIVTPRCIDLDLELYS